MNFFRQLSLNPPLTEVIRAREIHGQRLEEFPAHGYKKRYVFPHSIYFLRKPGPDGLKLAHRMCGCRNLSHLKQVILFAESPAIDEFPDELFFDDDLLWHQQHLGKKGQIATATLAQCEGRLYCLAPHSDIVQRISRHRKYKTRIEKAFKGWMHMLLNGILNFAMENHISTVCIPTSQLALLNTDHQRSPGPGLFERIYDQYVRQLFDAQQESGWWLIDLAKNKEKMVCLDKRTLNQVRKKRISVCHNITRGFGRNRPLSGLTNEEASRKNMQQMLSIEKSFQIKATYHVLGCLFAELRHSISEEGHCLSFYSFDHDTDRNDQLARCRKVDYRIKGITPFRNTITSELTDINLAFHNFEWLAGSTNSLRTKEPLMRNGIVRIPIHFDDSKMAQENWSYSEWERYAIKTIRRNDFVSFCLHDCYGHFWLSHYERFLEKIMKLAELSTMNEVSNQVILSHSI